ncbi:MAG TPA: bifunctional (p)ppGpp synthetase/guanosine-3',5'-bis(diphosphate) 3'-pyrophosphohydrolase [Clostridiaceae bacterium]|nr:bifunctional (p)ppGpp synthetase/guanosine-3',5'-bis(diphosphate) 3'-pyrophosphohydrolase [Clostridiaceae bacterium]
MKQRRGQIRLRENEFKQINRTVERLYRLYESYSPEQDMTLLKDAVTYAMDAHANQKRATGEPYIIHPLAVAEILTELEMDQETLCAALLHDTVEDTGKTKAEIADRFGDDVAEMVDGVTKLDKVSFHSKEELQAENFRKMFLAMAKDIRVVIIKLADRLHNMRTMKHLPPTKQQIKAQETLDIYAPLAHRLGIYKWKWELEDLCFRYLNTSAYYELVGAIAQRRSEREAYLDQVVSEISAAMKKIGIEAEIEGRPKHFYSIYRKMMQKGKAIDEIYDLFACRIIVQTVAECYAVLGHVHEMYHPMPGRFKDYIATPKQNMYQSLHTTVIGPKGVPFEVQIRTFEMHRTAEFGIAAHYRYKNKGSKQKHVDDSDQKLSWLRQLLEWQKDMKDADEYLASLKDGLIEDDVYVFTPRGDVVALPQGAVPIDFAYSIHSGVGNSMYGAKVDGRMVPLTHELKNGEIVEILTSDKVHGPSRDWINIVKSTSAKSKIRHWFKREMRDEDIAHGKEIVDREIKKTGFSSSQLLKANFLEGVMRRYNCKTLDDLYANIGHGTLSVAKVVPRLRDEYIKSLSDYDRRQLGYKLSASGQVVTLPGSNKPEKIGEEFKEQKKSKQAVRTVSSNDYGIVVKGQSDCLVRLSRCCNPVPGDPIIGYTTRGRGVAVHRRDCSNIRKLLANSSLSPEDAQRAARLIEVAWNEDDLSKSYEVTLKIIAQDRMQLLNDITNAIGAESVFILSGEMSSFKGVTAIITIRIEVEDQNQYERVVGRIKAVRDVIQVIRGN